MPGQYLTHMQLWRWKHALQSQFLSIAHASEPETKLKWRRDAYEAYRMQQLTISAKLDASYIEEL
jgi:hypothetical protein